MANKTEEHKEKLKKANIGKIWVTDRKNKKTFRTHPEVVNNETIFKGRNNYDKN